MPRLVGRTSKTPLYTTIAVLILAAATALEYTGEIDLVPGFGRDNPSRRSTHFYDSDPRRPIEP
ncbi:hypothetical protein [Chamaesiphon polymorphus]|nr:hypothetical protein [Chamaesiphon polymorphus]